MEQAGRPDPSDKTHISINFRTSENDEKVLNILKEIQSKNLANENEINEKNTDENEIILKIHVENAVAFVYLNTNVCKRAIKMIIDTGASITILADDIVKKEVSKINYIVNLYGIFGKETSCKTNGVVVGLVNVEDKYFATTMHLVDRKYSGIGDGYLGFDTLSAYKAVIDINNMTLKLNLKNINIKYEEIIIENGTPINIVEENFVNILAKSYDFEEYKNDEKFNKYYEAMNYYENEIKKRAEIKVNAGLEISKENKYFHNYDVRKIKPMDPNAREFLRVETIFQKLNLNGCTHDEKDTIRQLCEEFPYQFYVDGDILGTTKVVKCKINLVPNAKPVWVPQYRIPQIHREALVKLVDDFERQGIIEKGQSNYNSPVILINKTDDKGTKTDLRMVVDFRKLNQTIEMQNFPIPLIEDILMGLTGCSIFSSLDLKGAFYHIEMEEESKKYTAFTVNGFIYWFRKMPMGLKISPSCWQLAINTIMKPLIGKGVYVYLDDVIIYARDKEEHDRILWKIMELLKENDLQLSISKCMFYAKQFEYLGHIITKDGIKANPKKVAAIKEYARPINIKGLQRFLGMCNFYRKFVHNYSKIAKPLTLLLKKDHPYIWTSNQQEAFDRLKEALAEEVTLKFPDMNDTFYVTTDASSHSIAGVLSQSDNRPISFFSKTLNDAQRNYSTIHRELLAIVESVKAFRVYLYGRFFVLITDHKPLCYLFNMKDCNSRLFRQKMELMNFEFKILYKEGKNNYVADALSRVNEPLSIEELIEIERDAKNHAVVTRDQDKKDQDMKSKKLYIEEKSGTVLRRGHFDLIFHLIPKESDVLKERIINKFGISNFTEKFHRIHGGHYYRMISNQFANHQNRNETQNCINSILEICQKENASNIAVNLDYDSIRHYMFFKNLFEEIFKPHDIEITFFLNKILELKEREDIDKIMELYHRSMLGGHTGTERMYKTISRFYRWNNMLNDIKNYVKKCEICEKTKITKHERVPLQISSLGESLFDHSFCDFVGPIAPSSSNNRYIFTVTCDITKMLVAQPTKTCDALAAAEVLLEHVICQYNFPSRLISDNATNFLSQVIKELTRLFQIKKILTTIYHPQSNIVERQHRTLNNYLRAYCHNKRNWDQTLKFAVFAYNNTIQSTTGYTPHRLAYGFDIVIPNHLRKPKLNYNYANYADNVRNSIADALKIAQERLMKRKEENKKYYDQNARECDVKVGDLVLIQNKLKNHKFDPPYTGPYEVLKAEDVYVEILRGNKPVKVHKNMIKLTNADYDKSIAKT